MDLWPTLGIAGAAIIGAGFSLRKLNEHKIARYEAKLKDRLDAGEDRYLDELRELEAYDPRKRPIWQNVAREIALITVAFAAFLVFAIRPD